MPTQPTRYIAHFDLDSFFVSVEIANNPALKGLPVIVGGSKERGVVAACSYEARKFGVHSAMPMKKAMQLCPQAILVKGTRGEYSRYSKWVTEIIAARVPLFEKASIDEFYIDLTGMDKFFDVFQFTKALRETIVAETKLPISFGLACNKLVAKIATDEAKPNGFLWVQPRQEKEFLAALPVYKIPGVGKNTTVALQQLGIETIAQLQTYPTATLEKLLGSYALELQLKANGIHHGEVQNYHEAKSISTEQTFNEPITQLDALKKHLLAMIEKLCFELRSNNRYTTCVAVKLRKPNFDTATKQMHVTGTASDKEIFDAAWQLLQQLYQPKHPVRLLGARLSHFVAAAPQTQLFTNVAKTEQLYQSIDAIKQRFGKQALTKAAIINKKTT
ncbi:MAG: DNA polymerase IV [Bacteroidetes bacterium]|nr:MAG: DNA polymerase IV [Bacteroidota bacterium]